MVVVVIFFSFRRRSRDAVAAPAFSVSSPATRAIAIARQRSKRKRNVLCGRARVLLPRVLVRIFPNNNIITGLSLSLGSAFISFYVYITINDYSCSYHLIVLRGVCVSAARVARPTEELSRALNFCGKKKEKMNQKKSSKVLLLLLLLLLLRLLLLLILLEFSVFVFVFDAFIIELVKVFKFGQTSLDLFLPL